MYNSELKEQFIRQHTNNINAAKDYSFFFKSISKYEEKFEADLYTFDAEQLKSSLAKILGIRSSAQRSRISYAKKYIEWCKDQGFENVSEAIYNVDLCNLERLKLNMVPSPLQLQQFLNLVFDPELEETTHNLYRIYFWLAFCGVDEEDVLKIKASEVDLSKGVIYYKNKELEIYKQAKPAFKNCIELEQFVFKHPDYMTHRDRIPGEELIRGVRGEYTVASLRTAISAIVRKRINDGEQGIRRLSYYRVWLSGLFYRTYELEMNGITPDFSEAVFMHLTK